MNPQKNRIMPQVTQGSAPKAGTLDSLPRPLLISSIHDKTDRADNSAAEIGLLRFAVCKD